MMEQSVVRRDLEKSLMGITRKRKLTETDEENIKEKAKRLFNIIENYNKKRTKEVEESKRLDTSTCSMSDPKNRAYIDGCFDLMHAGHFNAIRQASYLTPWLVVGPNSDEEITKNKGPTVLNDEERASICSALKWTDEVVPQTPYAVTTKLLDEVNCKYWVHGDDPCYDLDGNNLNDILTKAGRFKLIKRTTGISTTDLTGRLLELLEPFDPLEEEKLAEKRREPAKQQFL